MTTREGATNTKSSSTGKRDARRSLVALAFFPVSVIVGFVLGSALLGDPNAPDALKRWDAFVRIVPLWLVIETPSILGIVFGIRAMRAGERSGSTGLILNSLVFAFFTLVTLVGGTVDAFK
jgi:hypothetical protein